MSSRTVSTHKGTHIDDGWEVHPHLGWDGDGKMSINAANMLLGSLQVYPQRLFNI